MNGGQTYIYPTNYHCQSSFNEDVDGGELAASDDDKNQSNDTFDDVEVVEAVPVTLQENAEVCLLNQTRLNSISEENGQDVVNGEEDRADLNQLVSQQPILSPFANSFDYAQFYNAFYYPGCMVAPFPVVGNGKGNSQEDSNDRKIKQMYVQCFRNVLRSIWRNE